MPEIAWRWPRAKPSGYRGGVALATWLDRVLYRHPFEGPSARRYAELERPAFGDLDDRLLDELAPVLGRAQRLLDLGAGPATFATNAAARHPGLTVIALEPSRDFARRRPGIAVARACGEALPLTDASIDVAMCLSSIRHVHDREATLRELRRVVRDTLVIVELDPHASAARIAAHASQLGSRLLRRAFGPLVVRTAPPAHNVAALAARAGFTRQRVRADAVQPVYIMELS